MAPLILAAAVLTGCGGATSAGPGPGPGPRSSAVPAVPASSKVLLIVLENHTAAQARDRMPFLTSQGRRFAEATHSRAVGHPSLPNYLALTGGSSLGVTSDPGPATFHVGGLSVFGQALTHGRTAKVYVEGMDRPCQQRSTRLYSHLINPWVYFVKPSERRACRRLDMAAGTGRQGRFGRDVARGRLPNVGMLVPTMCHNGHNCSLATTDRWLRRRVEAIERGPDFRRGHLTVVVTFDEDDYTGHNRILTVFMNRDLHHRRLTEPFSHLAVSALLSGFAGAAPLRDARPVHALTSLAVHGPGRR